MLKFEDPYRPLNLFFSFYGRGFFLHCPKNGMNYQEKPTGVSVDGTDLESKHKSYEDIMSKSWQ